VLPLQVVAPACHSMNKLANIVSPTLASPSFLRALQTGKCSGCSPSPNPSAAASRASRGSLLTGASPSSPAAVAC